MIETIYSENKPAQVIAEELEKRWYSKHLCVKDNGAGAAGEGVLYDDLVGGVYAGDDVSLVTISPSTLSHKEQKVGGEMKSPSMTPENLVHEEMIRTNNSPRSPKSVARKCGLKTSVTLAILKQGVTSGRFVVRSYDSAGSCRSRGSLYSLKPVELDCCSSKRKDISTLPNGKLPKKQKMV